MYPNGMPILYLPRRVMKNALTAYFLALGVVTIMYISHRMAWYFMLFGIIGVMVFFVYGRQLSKEMSVLAIHKAEKFEKRIFFLAFVLRLLFVLLMYWSFLYQYGNAFGFENADASYYHSLGAYVADLIWQGDFHFYDRISFWSGRDDISDMGYGIYLGVVYLLTDNNILVARVLKCVWSALTVLLVYRLAKRSMGEQTARVAAVFCALWPNFWYYCSAHLKETEMVFLTVLYVEQADQMLRSRQFTAWKVIPVLLIAAVLFTFRTPLGLVALLALLFALVMSSTKVVSWGKRVIIGILAIAFVGVVAGTRIEERANSLIEQVLENQQQTNMEWRSQREHGNKYARYASSAIFAPMIFTLPFPTMVSAYDGQKVQQLNNGGNFIKNVMSFFTILALFSLLLSGHWRNHALPLAFLLGYLLVLTMSAFPHSERFHQPAMPFEMMFMSYGLAVAMSQKKYKRWYSYWCVVMFIAVVAWNWFKMKGRGL